MGLNEREQMRSKSGIVGSLLNESTDKPKKNKPKLSQRGVYLEPKHVKALAFEKAETGEDISQIVRRALDLYFGDKLKKYDN